MPDKPRKRIWVKTVDVSATALEVRLDVAAAQGLGPDQQVAADGARMLLGRARAAANRVDPAASRWANWWRGAAVDPAFQNLHAAMAQMVDVYDEAELVGEMRTAAARSQTAMHRDDPRRIDPVAVAALPIEQQRAVLRRAIADTYSTLDRRYEQIRSFRNIVLLSVAVMTVLLGVTMAVVASTPDVLPLCFDKVTGAATSIECPTGSNAGGPSSGDVLFVALLGALGAALASALSIRKLQGTSVPYDVPVALALLKLPLGALTSIVGLTAIRGGFLPGLSALDSQAQIVAYALILGFAQQTFTGVLDRRAQDLLTTLPSTVPTPAGDGTAPAAPAAPVPQPPGDVADTPSIVDPDAESGVIQDDDAEVAATTAAPSGGGAHEAAAAPAPLMPSPVDPDSDDDDIEQDDEAPVMPNAIERAHP